MAGPNQAENSGKAGGEEGSERLCALTRAELPSEELIRFVAAPDGEVVPDLGRRLPGRGVWLKGEKDIVAAAVRARVFTKSLKRSVKVSGDLAEMVDDLLQKRALEALSLANKAGLVTTGFAQVESLVQSGEAAVMVHGSDAAAGGQEKLDRKFGASCREMGREAATLTLFSIEQMSLAMGRFNVVHAALKRGGATDKFLREAGRLARYRPKPHPAGPA